MKNIDYEEYNNLYKFYKKRVSLIASFRMVVFILLIFSFLMGKNNTLFNAIGVVLIVLFLLLIIVHDHYYKKLDYYQKFINVLNEYKFRINGKWKKFVDTGFEFETDMFKDLNIVGKNSLFQYLNVCKTIKKRKKLISRLSNKNISRKDIIKNQESVKELSNNPKFMVDFQVNMMIFDEKKVDLFDDIVILDNKVGSKILDVSIGTFFAILSCMCLILGLFKIISFKFFYGILIFNFLINYIYSFIYREEFENSEKVSNEYSKLLTVYKLIIVNNFSSKLLSKYKKSIEDSLHSINNLVFINDLNAFKSNILSSFIFNGLFCINVFVMFLYSRFQKLSINDVRGGIDSLENLEALISLAGLGLIRDDVCIPIIDDNIRLEFRNLKYPLLAPGECVGNDFSDNNGVNIITGSNMGGKTSFLRTIGINLILMNAGGYVCADSFSSCYFKIFTSINVDDDIDNGISTFYGELLRIKKALDYDKKNKIVLIDEIFKGTNYQDRLFGAKKVIEKLNNNYTVSFITTHDFELCDIKGDNINNYNVSEYYEGDSIKFDYKIRKGKCQSTNAKYLMKKLNIID